MSKSKFTKILVAVLSFCLILGTIFGVSAFAEETENSKAAAPEIISKNVEYGSKVYLYYAVPVASIPEADRVEGGVWLNVYDADGTLAFKQFAEEATDDIYGTVCYIFKTRGVPAKELNTVEKVQVETKSGAKSDVESYSVEEYLYDRLYDEGFVAKTEADGKDYIRRGLYYNLLKYGKIAQELLAPEAEDKIGGVSYVKADAATASLGRFEEPTKVVVHHDSANTPASSSFLGWEYTLYDEFGELVESGYALDGASIVADGYAVLEPVYETINHNYTTFDDGTFGNASYTITGNNDKVSYGGVSIVDGKLVATKSMTKDEFTTAINNWNTNNPDDTITAPGSIGIVSYFSIGNKVEGANVVEFTVDYSYKGANSLEYIEIYTGKTASSPGTMIWGIYVPISGGKLQFNGEYVSGNTRNKNVVNSPIKCDGTVYKLTVRVIFDDDGSARVEFYCDGELFFTGRQFYNNIAPTIDHIGGIRFRMSNNPKGDMAFDNVAMTQARLEHVNTEFKKLEVDFVGNDFNSDYSDSLTITTNNNFKDLNKWEVRYDEVTGDGYLFVDKAGKDTSGKTYLGGVVLEQKVSEKQEGANLAVFEFDILLTDVSAYDAQITMGHQGISGNAYSPMLFVPKLNNAYNVWHRVTLTYEVTEVDANGVPVSSKSVLYIDGVRDKMQFGCYQGATQLKPCGGKYNLPTVDQVNSFTFALNNSFLGDAFIDNMSVKLIKKDGHDPKVVNTFNIPAASEENAKFTFEEMPAADLSATTVGTVNKFTVEASATDNNGVTKENVLYLNKTETGKNATLSASNPTVAAEGGNALVFTMDILAKTADATDSVPAITGIGGVAFYINDGSSLFQLSNFVTVNKWCNLTVIAREVEDGVVSVDMYINGILKGSGITYRDIDFETAKLKLVWQNSTLCHVYMDNVSYSVCNYNDFFN